MNERTYGTHDEGFELRFQSPSSTLHVVIALRNKMLLLGVGLSYFKASQDK